MGPDVTDSLTHKETLLRLKKRVPLFFVFEYDPWDIETSLQASNLRQFKTMTDLLTGEKCRATSVAENMREVKTSGCSDL